MTFKVMVTLRLRTPLVPVTVYLMVTKRRGNISLQSQQGNSGVILMEE